MKRSLIVLLVAAVAVAHRATLTSNGYSDILVAISPDAPKDQANVIVDNIKRMFREASPVLYKATRNRAYFKNVRILLPDSWTSIPAQNNTWESYNEAEIRVAPPNQAYGDTPYTLQTRGCGQAGDYIHLTPNYIRTINSSDNTARYGPAGKVLVHEWAHLRYGVFDEYGLPGDRAFPLFYRPSTQAVVGIPNEITPNVCANTRANFYTQSIQGGGCNIDPNTGLYDANCRYYFSDAFKPKSSLMADHSLPTVTDFCDEGETLVHNSEAPNKHNAMCSRQSIWKVITQHPDFTNNNNPPANITNVEPTFIVVRASMENTRFVLVADVSRSMLDNNRIGRLNQSAKRWIKYDIPDGSQLGLVQFSDTASVLAQLTKVTSTSRAQLMDKVPGIVISGTCIGCGLITATQMLKPTGNGGVIVLLTDGVNNIGGGIPDALPEILAAGIRVVTIAFGVQADPTIENLAKVTDGKSYFVADDDTSQGLNQAFTGSLTYQPSVSSDDLVVKLFEDQFKVNGIVNRTFSVDFTVGKNLVFRVDYTQKTYLKSAKLIAPNGTVYSNLVYENDASAAFIRLDMAMPGVWMFSLDLTGNTADTFLVTVTAQTKDGATAPIYTRCWVGNGVEIPNAQITPVVVMAEVKQGSNAVLGARVQAYIEKPSLELEILELFDNGAVADVTKNDGIYSRYFIMATSTGRYSVKCQVWDEGSAFINDGFIASAILVHDDAPYCCGSEVPVGKKTPTGNFTRSDAGGGFKVNVAAAAGDPYPPGRVMDLIVTGMDTNGSLVTLTWTAPGDDLDYGKSASYVLKYSNNSDDLTESNFDTSVNATPITASEIVHGSLQPLEFGKTQQVTVSLAKAAAGLDSTFFFALRAVDDSRKKSSVSNLAAVRIVDVQPDYDGLSGGAIAGIVIGCIAAVVLIGGLAFYVVKHKRR